ncbi:hypothetical protein [Streptacidiphilus sp. EB103A]|uniref:hypothetical protein n=1 Tax=Streptacidiphilus sp. EB103A TaxID=3156275 RepID=UPI0035150C27
MPATRRITADMVRALCAPPMAGGRLKDVLLWREGRAQVVPADDVPTTGGRIICTRADLLDAGLHERTDRSLAGPAAALTRRLAPILDTDLHHALTTDNTPTRAST